MNKPKKILYFAGTHWDREWYLPFEAFRFRLIQVMDEILETLEKNPAFSRFILDGQTSLLDDYLEIRPENRDRIAALMRAGKLTAGPWYTMPDEFLSSGESLVNNLLLGFDKCRGFGVDPMMSGHVCDVFGHIAQLPQILNGFGIRSALLGRGTNSETCPAHFIWKSPDGSACVTFKVPEECGYGTFFFDVINPYKSGRCPDWSSMLSRAKKYVEKELARSPLPYVVLMDSMDHEAIHPEAVKLAEELSKAFGCPVEFGAPSDILAELESSSEKMPVLTGELRETAMAMVEHNKLIPHTLSSRYDIKAAHDRCQNLLERRVGPMAVMAELNGSQLPGEYFSRVIKMLAECEAHDSICGCSIDQVCRDVLNRLSQAEIICGEMIDFYTVAVVNFNAKGEELKLVFYNTETEHYFPVTKAYIDFPEDYPAKKEYLVNEPYNMFTIRDKDGKEIPYQLLDIEKGKFVSRPGAFYREKRDRYHIALEAGAGPLALKEYFIFPSKPMRNTGTMLTGPLCMENSYIKAEADNCGFLIITDKTTGRVYRNLLGFKDYGETADGWFHQPPVANPVVIDNGANTGFEVWRDGSEICILKITKYMRVPARLNRKPTGISRSDETKEIKIISFISLSRNSRVVEIDVIIENTALDHKMTVNFPTGLNTDSYEADQSFAIISRRAGVKKETSGWKEFDRGDHAFTGLVIRRNEKGEGLAFLSAGGTHECNVHDDHEGTMEITLFRSFGKTFLTNGEPDGQLLRKLDFHFALLPLGVGDTAGSILKIRNAYVNPPLCYTTRGSAGDAAEPAERAGLGFSLESENIVLSSLRPSREKGFICVRLVNYGGSREEARVLSPAPIAEAYASCLSEEKQASVPFSGNEIKAALDPYMIGTFLVRLTR